MKANVFSFVSLYSAVLFSIQSIQVCEEQERKSQMGATSSSSSKDDFHLITLENDQIVLLGSDVIIPCFLSPGSPTGDKNMEIRWFKETDCVCLYKNRQMIKGMGYENRVRLFTEGVNNLSLTLQFFRWSDAGDYTCQVTSGDRTEEITVRVKKQNIFYRFKHMANGAVAGALAILLVISEVTGAKGVEITAAVAGLAAAGAATAAANIIFMKKDRTWSELERLKMEMSAILAETQSCLAKGYKLKIKEQLKCQLATLKLELQDKFRQLQKEMEIKEQSSHSVSEAAVRDCGGNV